MHTVNFPEYIARDSFVTGSFVSKLIDVENWGFAWMLCMERATFSATCKVLADNFCF